MESVDYGMIFFVTVPVLILATFAILFATKYREAQRRHRT